VTTTEWHQLGLVWRGVRTGRPPTVAEQRIARVDQDRRRAELGLSSRHYDPDSPTGVEVTVDPENAGPKFTGGSLPRRRRALKMDERPFRRAVDEWLARGGWAAGEQMKASVAVEWVRSDDPRKESREKRLLVNRWVAELKARGWTGKLVTTRFVNYDDGRQRLFWWSTPAAVALGRPPEPPKGRLL
jgi:hypothetical protein